MEGWEEIMAGLVGMTEWKAGMAGWGGEFGVQVEDSGGPIDVTSGWRSSRREGFEDDYALVEYELVNDLNPEPATGEE